MKTLVVYYSMNGTVRKFADLAAKLTKADVEELKDHNNYHGAGGFFKRLGKAAKKGITELDDTLYNPLDYDRIIICTPLWGDTISPAVRTYLKNNKDRIKKLSLVYVGNFSEGNAAKTEIAESGFSIDQALGFIVKNNLDDVLRDAQVKMSVFSENEK